MVKDTGTKDNKGTTRTTRPRNQSEGQTEEEFYECVVLPYKTSKAIGDN